MMVLILIFAQDSPGQRLTLDWLEYNVSGRILRITFVIYQQQEEFSKGQRWSYICEFLFLENKIHTLVRF